MGAKRTNPALWKINVAEEDESSSQISRILDAYAQLTKTDSVRYPTFDPIALNHSIPDVTLSLYVRRRRSHGLLPFLDDYIAIPGDKAKLRFQSVDACLFIATTSSLFSVTSGGGYRLFEDYVDYAFPFDTAKKLIANEFRAADTREFTGPRASRTETYRQGYSIARSESFGKVWKRLVGQLDSDLLSADSQLAELVDTKKKRVPTVEVKSSFILRKRLDLPQLVSLAQKLEDLPEPTEAQREALSFLDNLYIVRGKQTTDMLMAKLIESFRRAIVDDEEIELDICDPDPEDSVGYYSGAGFKVSYWSLGDEPPQKEDIVKVLRNNYPSETLEDAESFRKKICSTTMLYNAGSDDDSPKIRKDLIKFMHGQIDHDGETFFLLDKIWYRSEGSYLENLKRDFIQETFSGESPTLITSDLGFEPWGNYDEEEYNKRQSSAEGFFYGDRLFAKTDRGKVELFDLLRIDGDTTYVIHAKAEFNAKMRDACSQILLSADVIQGDRLKGSEMLGRFYRQEWIGSERNQGSSVSESEFLSWFERSRRIFYVVLISTKTPFERDSFEQGKLFSHIARREIVTARKEIKDSYDDVFRIAHTARVLD